MTTLARNWSMVFLLLNAYNCFLTIERYGPINSPETLGYVFGALIGSLFCGIIVTLIIKSFWKKYSTFEIWFAASTTWFALGMFTEYFMIP
jgi:hypothetical protein